MIPSEYYKNNSDKPYERSIFTYILDRGRSSMSYEVYKLIHIVSIMVFFGTLGASVLAGKYSKHEKIITGVSSFLIFFGGGYSINL